MSANILDRRGFAMVVGACLKGVAGSAFLAVLLALGVPAYAQQAQSGPGPVTVKDMFVAGAVPVDITAANITDARERGLTQGRVNGFRKIIERIVAREDLPRVPQLQANQIIDLVRDFSIANERSSAVRYLADLTVRFDGNAVRRLLRGANIPFTETLSKPLVVVPIMREGNGRWVLWEQNNVWREAWTKVPRDLGLVPLIPVGGEREDMALTADQAANKDLSALNALAARYGAGGTVIAMATMLGETIQMSLVELRSDVPSEDLSLSESVEAGQTRDDFVLDAAKAAGGAVQDSWKRRNRVAFGGTTQITALVPVADLKEWITIKSRLDDVQLIDKLELQAITRDRAQVTLYYAGAQRQLELAMSQHDLALAQQNGVWIIQARGLPPRPAAKPAAAAPAAAPAASGDAPRQQ
jgi:hypothetical protein